MEISWWRDLVIVVWGLVATVVAIVITVIAVLLYKRLIKTIDSIDEVAVRASELIEYTEEEIIQPVAKVGGLIQGILKTVNIISNLFKKKQENGDEER